MARARLPSGCTSIVSGLSNAEDMTRSKFLKRGLKRVAQKHRNGGVHDSPTPEEVCRECVEVLSYCQIWCLKIVGHAAIWLGLMASIPSLNVTPVMTLAR